MKLNSLKYEIQSYINSEKLYEFDGFDDGVFLTNWNYQWLDNNHDWSIDFFINPGVNTEENARIFSSVEGNRGVDIRLNTSSQLAILFYTGVTNTTILGELKENFLNHVTICYSPTSYELYINGVLKSEATHSLTSFGKTGSNRSISIAAQTNDIRHLNASFSYFRIFNKKLTISEILYIHNYIGTLKNSIAEYVILEQTFQGGIFKADASFVSLHPEFTIGDNLIATTESNYNSYKKSTKSGILSDEGGGMTRITANNTYQIGDIVNIYNGNVNKTKHKIISVFPTYFIIEEDFSNFTSTTDIVTNNAIEEVQYMKINGKTDDELGLISYSTQTTQKNFYNNTLSNVLLRASENNFYQGVNGNDPLNFLDWDRDFTIMTEMYYDPNTPLSGRSSWVTKQDDNGDYIYLRTSQSGNSINMSGRFSRGGVLGVFSGGIFLLEEGLNTVYFVVDYTNNEFRTYLNKNLVATVVNGISNGDSTFPVSSTNKISYYGLPSSLARNIDFLGKVLIWDSALSDDDVFYYDRNPKLSITPSRKFNPSSNEICFDSDGNQYSLQGKNTEELLIGSETWLDKKSFIPPIIQKSSNQGLSFTGVHNSIDSDFCIIYRGGLLDLTTLINNDFVNLGTVFSYSMDDVPTNPTPKIKFGNAELQFSYNGFMGSTTDVPFNPEITNTYIINYKRIALDSYDIEIFVNGLLKITGNVNPPMSTVNELVLNKDLGDTNTSLFGISLMNLSKIQILEIGNLNLPPKEFVDNSLTLLQFQEGSAYEDGTDVLLKNLGSGVDLTIAGLTGITSSDKLIDWRTNRVIFNYL